MDYMKRICFPEDIINFYLKYHNGIIERDIIIYLQEEFFEISLPTYIFEYKRNRLYLSKIKKTNLKGKKISFSKNKLSFSCAKKKYSFPKRHNNNNSINSKYIIHRRSSCFEHLRKTSISENLLLLDHEQKKFILYFYYLDMNLDNYNSIHKNDNNLEKIDSPKKNIIMDNNNNKNTGIRKRTNSKKKIIINSIKNKSDSIKKNKMPLFKNDFFSRNEITQSSIKNEKGNKKKSLLEYNLLFDPNLTGYNNLLTDVVFDPKTERTIINKVKRKELLYLNNKQINSFFISSGGMKTDKNIIVMKTLDLRNKYNYKNKGNINSLTSTIKDCNYDSFVKFYRSCNCGPNAIDKYGNSLLSLAVKSSCIEIVNFLLNEKANPNLQNVSIFL